MSNVIQSIIEPQQLTNADATYFTALVPTQILKATLCNSNTSTAYWVNVNWIPSGGSVVAANLVVNTRYLQPSETWDIWPLIGHVLNIGDKISMKASTGAEINVMASGVAVSGS